ncbi:MAG: hypothetical protein V4819_22360 [Verrucomicrobiota bacterium]
MTRLIATLFLVPLVTFAEPEVEEERAFALTNDYFDWDAKTLDYYPFTQDLKKIDEGIAGEYSYNWSIGVPATRHVVEAACLGDYDRVLLGWWRSTDRAARVATLAIYYCTMGPSDMSNFPQFAEDAKRFEATEAKERTEEIEFVTTQLPYFKNWLRSLVSDNLPEDSKFLKALGSGPKQETQQASPSDDDKPSK